MVHWKTPATIKNLQELRDKVSQKGGSIVEYQQVMAIVFFTRTSPVVEWVPPYKSRTVAGLKHALLSALLGWWSLTGLFWTPAAIIKNLMGGIDLTRLCMETADVSAAAEVKLARKRLDYVLAAAFLLCVLAIASFFLLHKR